MRHTLLQQQLLEFACDDRAAWSAQQWALLQCVSDTYYAHDAYVKALENDLVCSSKEKKQLSSALVDKEDELQRVSGRLAFQASHDALTQVLNREEFINQLDMLLEAPQLLGQFALLYLDLDRFKAVNDAFGHKAGDALIRETVALIRHQVGESTLFARLGGDEFAILVSERQAANPMQVAEQLRAAIEQHRFSWEEMSLSLSVSVGILKLHPGLHNSDNILTRVVTACHLAKDAGRNCAYLFRENNPDIAKHHDQLKRYNEIKRALEADQFAIFAQPMQALETPASHKSYYEILLRMYDAAGTMLLPAAFLPVAERYNVMPAIDKWVVKTVCDLLNQHADHITNIGFITVNLSGQSFTYDSFCEYVFDVVSKCHFSPDVLCFEITETVAIANLVKATEFIEAMRQLGCRFALDDFGSGMSSFAYLKRLPVDIIKIDGMFIKDMMHDEIDRAMVKSISEIGQVMGKEIIAEYVENDKILAQVQALGINYAQGYAVARPQPLADILAARVKKP